MAQAKKIGLYLALVFMLYTIITAPARATELVGTGFEGISTAAHSVGGFMTQIVD